MDKLSKSQRSLNMQAVKNKGSKIESKLMKALWHEGYRYRKNSTKIFGKPDISIAKYKIAIFCDSEFWHGKDWQDKKGEIKSNVEFWHRKIENNIKRDKLVNERLKVEGWVVLRFWGKDIERNIDICLKTIIESITKQKNKQ